MKKLLTLLLFSSSSIFAGGFTVRGPVGTVFEVAEGWPGGKKDYEPVSIGSNGEYYRAKLGVWYALRAPQDYEFIRKDGIREVVVGIPAAEHWDVTLVKNEQMEIARKQTEKENLYSELENAVVSKNINKVKELINQGVEIRPRLFIGAASIPGNDEVVKFLANTGKVDLNEVDTNGFTALMLAIIHNDTNIAEFLIQQGANINLRNIDGSTALSISLSPQYNQKHLNETLVKTLLEKSNITAFPIIFIEHALISGGSTPLITEMMRKTNLSENINAKDNAGDTILHRMIVAKAPLSSIEFLINNGANANSLNIRGTTPLMNAAWMKDYGDQTKVIESLADHGAYLEDRDKDGKTAYDIALSVGNSDAAEKLRELERKKK